MKTHGRWVTPVAGAGLLAGLLLAACASSTRLERSWVAPEAGTIAFEKVMVLALAPDEALRRSAEDAMRQEIERAASIASYEVIPRAEDLKDRMRVAEAIRTSGVDGLVVMRLVSDETETRYEPGGVMPPPYTSFWGYYTRPYALSPFYGDASGRIRTDRVLGIETNIYQAQDETLIWSGFTRSQDPANVSQLVADVADAVRTRLREQGLIAPP